MSERRLLIVYDYDADESGFVVVDVTEPLCRAGTYGQAREMKRILESGGADEHR
jgi:hypothetical protein